MAQVRIAWTRLAIADLNSVYEYLAAERSSVANHIVDRIEKAIHSISYHPEIGRHGRVEGTRELIVSGTPFIVPYRIKNNRIEVLAIIHGARRWPDSF